MARRHAFSVLAALAVVAGLSSSARAQQARLQVDRGLYAELPFVVSVVADGFDDNPQPDQPELSIDGCKVTPLGVSPNVQQSITVFNGRRSVSKQVTFVMRWRVQASGPGSYQIPAVSVTQGSKRASTRPATIRVRHIPSSPDMQLSLELPQRPVWVGETIPIHLDWMVRRDVADQQLVVPLFDSDRVRVQAPGVKHGADTMPFAVGASSVDLPYDQTRVSTGGGDFVRVRFSALLTPLQPGTLAVPPARVVAKLKVGMTRDRLGFPTQRVALFSAADQARTLEVEPLPLSGRPASFSGAVGASFSIETKASSSVVKLGEPVELDVTIRGDSRLDGLALPTLAVPDILDPKKFTVPAEPPAGRLQGDDGTTKQFTVTVQIKDPSVTTIPKIPFSYFDPEKSEYRTVTSNAIAMQVEGTAIVRSSDVVSGQPEGQHGQTGQSITSVQGVDLGLSSPAETMRTVMSVASIKPVLIGLYAAPLLLFLLAMMWTRTRAGRQAAGEVRAAANAVHRAVASARKTAARDAAGQLVSALRAMARTCDLPKSATADLTGQIETAGFAPDAADAPLPGALLDEIDAHVGKWARAPARPCSRGAAAAMGLLLALSVAGIAHAAGHDGERLSTARAAYDQAMNTDGAVSAAKFAQAERVLGGLAGEHPDRPELLTDWGNAALGAGDRGHAALAYRRALRVDPGLERARDNLEWLRGHTPDWVPQPAARSAADTLFFWHSRMPTAHKYLIAGIGFALAVLLVAPFGGSDRRRKMLRRVAVLPALVWVAMTASALLEPDASRDAVVVADNQPLRAADNPGAPAAIEQPLPGGTEVTVGETRDAWVRISLADGTRGWLPATSVERVVRE